MRIAILAAGAAGMYCGSCLRDSALAVALRRAGHDVSLVPLYSPLRVDGQDISVGQVFYGGLNTWLRYASRLFRHTPRIVDWLLDRPALLRWAGSYGAETSPARLGPLILSVLEGEHGPQDKELGRLADFLGSQVRPQVVSLPNLMLIGLAGMLHARTGAPIVCELTGEDVFLDAMAEPWRSAAQQRIRQRAGQVARFVATSHWYADRMADYLRIPRSRIEVVYSGVLRELLSDAVPRKAGRPTVGYLARVCPEKGLERLLKVAADLRRRQGMADLVVRIAGYLATAHRRWFASVQREMRRQGLDQMFVYEGQPDLSGKIAFLDSIDVLCVPVVRPEAKGLFVLEAMARGVPVVQPAHSVFAELIERTGGGLLVPADDLSAMADTLADLLRDPARREHLGSRGRKAVASGFTDDAMAGRMLEVYQSVQP